MGQVFAPFEFVPANLFAAATVGRLHEEKSILAAFRGSVDKAIKIDALGPLHQKLGIVLVLLHDQIMRNLKLYVAAGLPLDNPSVHIYRQSYVPAHSELTWILDCFTGFGEMGCQLSFQQDP